VARMTKGAPLIGGRLKIKKRGAETPRFLL